MFDELNQVVEQAQELTEQQPQESQKNAEWEASKQESIRVLRERADSAERRSLELERMIQANMTQQQQSKMQLVEEEDDFDLSDDTYIEGKHLKKYVKSLKKEINNQKQQFAQYHQQNESNQAEMRLKSRFNDFDTVVSTENLRKLELQKPELYNIIVSAPNLYDKAHAAYELIKNSGMLNNKYEDIDRRVEENKSKPRSASNTSPQTGDTPLSRVGDYRSDLTDERKAEILRQSMKYSGRI